MRGQDALGRETDGEWADKGKIYLTAGKELLYLRTRASSRNEYVRVRLRTITATFCSATFKKNERRRGGAARSEPNCSGMVGCVYCSSGVAPADMEEAQTTCQCEWTVTLRLAACMSHPLDRMMSVQLRNELLARAASQLRAGQD